MKKLSVVGLSVFSVLAFVGVALGYVVTGKTWGSVCPLYDNHALAAAWQSVAFDGASQWNGAGSSFATGPSSQGNNDLTMGAIDGPNGALGETTVSSTGSSINWYNMRFDTAETWYTGTGTPPANQLDARSVATHEFGHSLGLNETQSYNCSGSEGLRPTMCASYSYGKTWARSLEQDDRNGVAFIYPAKSWTGKVQPPSGDLSIRTDFLYDSVPLPGRIRKSDFVIDGIVTFVSETSWNQDGGQYWEDMSPDGETRITALPYFTVELSLVESVVDRVGLSKRVVLTILGDSPLSSSQKTDDMGWGLGDEVIVFGRKTDLAWRWGSSRTILQPVSSPRESLAKRGSDSLFDIESNGEVRGYSIDQVKNLRDRVEK